jgi:hypothetical protein
VPTLGESITQVRDMEGRAVVLRTVASHLRTKYVSRDSTPALAQMRSPDGSPVIEAVIENTAGEFEREAAQLEQAVKAAKATEVSDG